MDASQILTDVVSGFSTEAISVVDLTAPLEPEIPVLYLPPRSGKNTPKFTAHKISDYNSDGPWWTWGGMELGEHTGTHFDAPARCISGKDAPDDTTDKIPPENYIGPRNVIACSKDVMAHPVVLLTADGVRTWEADHREIEAGSWVLMHSDWCKRNSSTEALLNADGNGPHSPNPSVDCVEYLLSKSLKG